MSAAGSFLPMQLIYTGKTQRCLSRYDFSASFLLASQKIIGQIQKDLSIFLQKLSFPIAKKVKNEKGFPEEQHSLVIMDTLKGQGSAVLKKLCSENRYEMVIVPNNLTNKFQPVDLTVNKVAKAFIQNQYNDWLSNLAAYQLKSSKYPANIKISSKLSDLKPLHDSWIVICIITCKVNVKLLWMD